MKKYILLFLVLSACLKAPPAPQQWSYDAERDRLKVLESRLVSGSFYAGETAELLQLQYPQEVVQKLSFGWSSFDWKNLDMKDTLAWDKIFGEKPITVQNSAELEKILEEKGRPVEVVLSDNFVIDRFIEVRRWAFLKGNRLSFAGGRLDISYDSGSGMARGLGIFPGDWERLYLTRYLGIEVGTLENLKLELTDWTHFSVKAREVGVNFSKNSEVKMLGAKTLIWASLPTIDWPWAPYSQYNVHVFVRAKNILNLPAYGNFLIADTQRLETEQLSELQWRSTCFTKDAMPTEFFGMNEGCRKIDWARLLGFWDHPDYWQ